MKEASKDDILCDLSGENVAIEGAYVWDNVVIGDNCVIKAAVLGNGVHVLNGVKVQNNSIFSTNVRDASSTFICNAGLIVFNA